MLLGEPALDLLAHKHVAVIGLGGVGSWCAESLARAGIGELTLIDNDSYAFSNINRQLGATEKTIGMPKAEAMKNRILRLIRKSRCMPLFPFIVRNLLKV